MCGIASYIGTGTSINKLMYLMHDNDSRGGHSSGAYIDDKMYKCTEESGNLLSIIDKSDAKLFIGHTRYATHGVKTAENTHPYKIGRYIGCHNGVLSNYKGLCKDNSISEPDVDSKAIYLLMDALQTPEHEEYDSLGMHSGTINAVWTESDGQLYVYRRNNPLFRLRQDGGIYFSSLKEGLEAIAEDKSKVKEVTANKLFIYKANGELISSQEITITAQPVQGKQLNWTDYKTNDTQSYSNPYGGYNFYNSYHQDNKSLLNTHWEAEKETEDLIEDKTEEEIIETGLWTFEKAFDEMKYHGWIKEKDCEEIQSFIDLMYDRLYSNH